MTMMRRPSQPLTKKGRAVVASFFALTLFVCAVASTSVARGAAAADVALVEATSRQAATLASARNVTAILLPDGKLVYNGKTYTEKKDEGGWSDLLKPDTTAFWVQVGLVALCVLSAALAAGLTMGLVSIDAMKLHVTLEAELMDDEDADETFARQELREEMLLERREEIKAGSSAAHGELADINSELLRLSCRNQERAEHEAMKREKQFARRILPVVERHHLLLVTLLLTNAVANECMPIFLDQIVPSWLAISLSVTFVLIFGEVVPSAVFTGKHQLQIAAFFTPLVQVLMFLTGPVSYPIALLLDFLFGKEEHEAYNKDELKAFIRMHGHREPHQAVVVMRPHPDTSLPPPCPPTDEELQEAVADAKMLGIKDTAGNLDPHDAQFCTMTEKDFKKWLEKVLLEASYYPTQEWKVLMHPMSSERRDMNKPRAHIGFANAEDAEVVSNIINGSIAAVGGGCWMNGWIRVESEVAENQHAVRMAKLAEDECAILCGVIGIGETPVGEAAHLIDETILTTAGKQHKIFMLSHNTILDRGVLAEVMRRGYSRIPIYQVNEYVVTLRRETEEERWGMDLMCVENENYDQMSFGTWNKVKSVDAKSPASSLVESGMFIAAVNGVRIKQPSDYVTAMNSAGLEMTLTVYRDTPAERKRICGMLLTKRLLVLSPEDLRMVGDVTERLPLAVAPDETLLEALTKFRKGDSHMAIVTNNPEVLHECWREYRTYRLDELSQLGRSQGSLPESAAAPRADDLAWARPLTNGSVEVLGIITLEDVLEEFMGDITDETDPAAASRLPTGDKQKRSGQSNLLFSKSPYMQVPRLRGSASGGMSSSAKFVARLAHVKSTNLESAVLTPLHETTPLLKSGKMVARYKSCQLRNTGSYFDGYVGS